ncbi:hypothetical protein FQZ97_875680 [compost metagenome]
MASTHSPTCNWLTSPTLTTGRFLASIFITATSVCGSEPSTLALNSRRSVSFTVTSLASCTTCALVRMMPSLLTMKPEPSPRIGTSREGIWPRPPGNWPKNWANGSPSLADTLRVPLTLMFTTAGP